VTTSGRSLVGLWWSLGVSETFQDTPTAQPRVANALGLSWVVHMTTPGQLLPEVGPCEDRVGLGEVSGGSLVLWWSQWVLMGALITHLGHMATPLSVPRWGKATPLSVPRWGKESFVDLGPTW